MSEVRAPGWLVRSYSRTQLPVLMGRVAMHMYSEAWRRVGEVRVYVCVYVCVCVRGAEGQGLGLCLCAGCGRSVGR